MDSKPTIPAIKTDPQTGEHWIPASVRADGSVRKPIRVRHEKYRHPQALRDVEVVQVHAALSEPADLMEFVDEPVIETTMLHPEDLMCYGRDDEAKPDMGTHLLDLHDSQEIEEIKHGKL